MLNNVNIPDLLKAHPIFERVSDEKIGQILSDGRCKTISASDGNEIVTEGTGLSIILSGGVLVFRRGNGLPVLLQRLGKGKIFGAASLFSDGQKSVTELKAEGDASVFFIPVTLITELIEEDSAFALAYIAFLSGKIRFLNKRISELSAPSTTQKLAMFLISEEGDIAPTRVKLASALGIGRASLYRALDELTDLGLISIDGKTVTVKDREGLMAII